MNRSSVQAAQSAKLAQVRRLFLVEAIIASILIAGSFLLLSQGVGFAVLLGFLTFFIPSIVFFWRAFRWVGAKYAKQVASSLYLAESSKLVLSLMLFACSFKMLPPSKPLYHGLLIVTYIGFVVAHQIALLACVKLNKA